VPTRSVPTAARANLVFHFFTAPVSRND